jgi:hypothetical protein
MRAGTITTINEVVAMLIGPYLIGSNVVSTYQFM